MADPQAQPQTSVIDTANIGGSPLVTAAGALAAVSQYLAVQGATMPHDTTSWVQFGIGLVLAVLGALTRMPTAK